jgi:hypothetical protein
MGVKMRTKAEQRRATAGFRQRPKRVDGLGRTDEVVDLAYAKWLKRRGLEHERPDFTKPLDYRAARGDA